MNWWIDAGWPWVSSFLQSPGAGGLAAVGAAALAFRASRQQARMSAWWQRAEWGLALLTDEEPSQKNVDMAIGALDSLQASKLAKAPEQRFIRSILDAYFLASVDGVADHNTPAAATGIRRVLGSFSRFGRILVKRKRSGEAKE